ncbi:unnamed protein product [Pieris brassicae]|uniref:Uncharacterized protein n=1 Tax=Pieris brassicae TaxID=7116 RepID=A0A9P0TTA7_PIEBR|nr:unnamed protein product [Pieris brassicae]
MIAETVIKTKKRVNTTMECKNCPGPCHVFSRVSQGLHCWWCFEASILWSPQGHLTRSKSCQVFKILVNGKQVTVSIDRIKPAFILCDPDNTTNTHHSPNLNNHHNTPQTPPHTITHSTLQMRKIETYFVLMMMTMSSGRRDQGVAYDFQTIIALDGLWRGVM